MFKGNTLKEKAEYFWMYYKLPFLAVLTVLLIAAGWVSAAAGEKESAFEAMLFDSHTEVSGNKLEEDFAVYAGIGEDRKLSILTDFLLSDTSSGTYAMTSISRFYVDVGKEELDVCVMLEEDFENYAKSDCFLNLQDCMDAKLMEKLQGNLFYREGVPIGIKSCALPVLEETGCYQGKEAVAGILYNSRQVQTAVRYLEYLCGEQP